MKNCKLKTILIISLIITCNLLFSQKLSLAEMHTMSTNKNWETTNKYLIGKGWDFNNSEKGDDEHYNKIAWAYNKTGYDTERATSWFSIYTFDGLPNKVIYRFRKKEYYTAMLQQIHAAGYKLKGEEIQDKIVVATYSNPNYILEINYERVDDDNYNYSGSYTVYNVIVSKKGGIYDPNNGKKYDYDENGNVIAEYFLKEGKPDGNITYFNPDGTILKTTTMKMGVENGISTQYFYRENEVDSTNVVIGKYKGTVINDKKNGKWETFFINDGAETSISFENFIDNSKQGDFRTVSNDSIYIGKYKDNNIDGKFTVYKDLNKVFNSSKIETDTLKLAKIIIGNYKDNKKTGLWKHFDFTGQVTEEGSYIDSLKTGTWRYHYPKMVNQKSQVMDFSGKLYLEENYNNGKLNGKSIRYSELTTVDVPCAYDTSQTCHDYSIEYKTITSNYVDDVLDGEYEYLNNEGKIIQKGNFSNGNQTGTWTLFDKSSVIQNNELTYETGNFSYGKRQGEWKRYDNNNQLIVSCNFVEDELFGDHIYYQNNKPAIKRTFKANELTGYSVLDNQEKPIITYQLDNISPYDYTCAKTEQTPDGFYIKNYKVAMTSKDSISAYTFREDFENPSLNKKLDGYYLHKSVNDKILEEGTYSNNKKTGTWSYYIYDQNVKVVYKYNSAETITEEYYHDLKKDEPFSGEYIFINADRTMYEERKIKDGKRNGATRFKDANDKTIKKESYKDGVLKE